MVCRMRGGSGQAGDGAAALDGQLRFLVLCEGRQVGAVRQGDGGGGGGGGRELGWCVVKGQAGDGAAALDGQLRRLVLCKGRQEFRDERREEAGWG